MIKAAVNGLRFCTACQARRPEEGGTWRRGRGFNRWMCQPCAERKSASIYRNQTGKQCDVQQLMSKLYGRAR